MLRLQNFNKWAIAFMSVIFTAIFAAFHYYLVITGLFTAKMLDPLYFLSIILLLIGYLLNYINFNGKFSKVEKNSPTLISELMIIFLLFVLTGYYFGAIETLRLSL